MCKWPVEFCGYFSVLYFFCHSQWWWGGLEVGFLQKLFSRSDMYTYKPLLVVLSGISSPKNVLVLFWKFNSICPFFIVAFYKSSIWVDYIFILMLTLCWPILACMMATADETNCFPFPNRNGLVLSSRKIFDLSSFERLSIY